MLASSIHITMDVVMEPFGRCFILCRIGQPSLRNIGARIPWLTKSLPLKRYDCMLVMISIDRCFDKRIFVSIKSIEAIFVSPYYMKQNQTRIKYH